MKTRYLGAGTHDKCGSVCIENSVQHHAVVKQPVEVTQRVDRSTAVKGQQEVIWTYLPKPAIPNLFQVEKIVTAQVCGLQELDWTT